MVPLCSLDRSFNHAVLKNKTQALQTSMAQRHTKIRPLLISECPPTPCEGHEDGKLAPESALGRRPSRGFLCSGEDKGPISDARMSPSPPVKVDSSSGSRSV